MLEKPLVKSSKKDAFKFVVEEEEDLEEMVGDEKAETAPNEDRPAAFKEVLRTAATEQRKIIVVLPKIILVLYGSSKKNC